ncbi:hypothetical protein DAE56_24900 [Salmonella enterica]|nr:hypothetical protein [Salmonella enterica]
MATTPTPSQSKIVYLPYVCAVDPEGGQLARWMREAENELLDRVKAALDEAGVAWIDTRTKERSKPVDSDACHITPMAEVGNTDSAEGCDNAQ